MFPDVPVSRLPSSHILSAFFFIWSNSVARATTNAPIPTVPAPNKLSLNCPQVVSPIINASSIARVPSSSCIAGITSFKFNQIGTTSSAIGIGLALIYKSPSVPIYTLESNILSRNTKGSCALSISSKNESRSFVLRPIACNNCLSPKLSLCSIHSMKAVSFSSTLSAVSVSSNTGILAVLIPTDARSRVLKVIRVVGPD